MPLNEKPTGKASPNFTWAELLYLPKLGAYHQVRAHEKANLIKLAKKLEKVRAFLGKPVNITSAIRPTSVAAPGTKEDGKNYNRLIGGAPSSAHVEGLAADFTVSTMTCDDVRFLLEPKLEEFEIRMERGEGTNWVHIDLKPVKNNRFFHK